MSDVLGGQLRHLSRIEAAGQGAAHVGDAPQVLGQGRRGADGGRRLHGRGRQVGQRREDPHVGEVELAEADLGEGDDARDPLVVAHRHHDHRLVDLVRARDRHPARIGVGVGDQERAAVGGDPAREALPHLEAQVVEGDRLVAVVPGGHDGHQVVRLLEDVHAAGVIVDDRPDLVGHRLGHRPHRRPAGHPGGRPLGDLELGDPALGRLARLVDLGPHRRQRRRRAGDLLVTAGEANDDQAQRQADDGEGGQLDGLDRLRVGRVRDRLGHDDGGKRDRGDHHALAGRQGEGGEDEGHDRERHCDIRAGEPEGGDDVQPQGEDGDELAARAKEHLGRVADDGFPGESRESPGETGGALRGRPSGSGGGRGLRDVAHVSDRRIGGASVRRGESTSASGHWYHRGLV